MKQAAMLARKLGRFNEKVTGTKENPLYFLWPRLIEFITVRPMIRQRRIFLLSALLLGLVAGASAAPDTLRLAPLPLPAAARTAITNMQPAAHVWCDADWYTWCGSVVQGPDGQYHLFYARWPRATGMSGWLVFSEIAHATAPAPQGPYHFKNLALPSRGKFDWNRLTAHNPDIVFVDGRWFLFHIGTFGEASEEKLLGRAKSGVKDPVFLAIRNNQRTGLATADSPDGPWKVTDHPVVEPGGCIIRVAVNPAVCKRPEGDWLMILKGDRPGSDPPGPARPGGMGFIRNQAVALAKSPEGPFKVTDQPVIGDLDTEDACIWRDTKRQRYYAAYHSTGKSAPAGLEGQFIGMLTSDDGLHWQRAAQPIITPKELRFDDGSVLKAGRMERPFVLTDAAGQPTHLFVAFQLDGRAYNICIPLSATDGKPN